ncbi:hypothetical protein [Luteolibacter sp. Populi]|uniref:hypothetical protein n=1 Tax=Luteolibacter sp. Populi TaxID=3230487 RepID=UPI00346711DE
MSVAFAGISNEQDFSYGFRDFLDRFREAPDFAMISDEPASLKDALNDDGLADAYLASIAAWLARRHDLPVPDWAVGTARALAKPWFAAKTHKLRMVLLQESPVEFRVRNLFVSANALSRA